MKFVLSWLPVVLGLTFLAAIAFVQRDRALKGENDFVQLYTGATLARTPDLYSRPANLAVVQKTIGFTMESVVYTRPPFYASLLRPIAWLPYQTAYAVFSMVSLACAVWFVIRFAKECASLPIFAALSVPVVTAITSGQDTPFLLAVLGGFILMARAKKDFWAGVLLVLIAVKFHLFLFVPLLLLLKRKWLILGGALFGSVALAGLSISVSGTGAWLRYVDVLMDPWINPSAMSMPNIHGLVAILKGGMGLELVFITVVAGAFFWTVQRSQDFEFLLAASLACGLLVSFHCGVADYIVLLPAFVAIMRTTFMPSVRVAWALILTPLPYLMSMAEPPYCAFLPVSLLIVFGFSVLAVGKRGHQTTLLDEAACSV